MASAAEQPNRGLQALEIYLNTLLTTAGFQPLGSVLHFQDGASPLNSTLTAVFARPLGCTDTILDSAHAVCNYLEVMSSVRGAPPNGLEP